MNRLAHARSPYLRQHAQNPIDWYEWGAEPFHRARVENKPIFLSIGYAACHWCHVMAHESFNDPHIAAILNQHFIAIKVDREERPDVDHIYMTATVVMTGSGGWPLSLFLTPDGTPFFAGTYFPPTPRCGIPSFREVLEGILRVWYDHPSTLAQIAKRVREEVHRQQSLRATADLSPALLRQAADMLCRQYDKQHGGWGPAPKFPHPMTLEFLLRRHLAPEPHPGALACVTHTLRAMARGGIYDVVGGGFARYATDDAWLIPHFEKMLYDNALLARAYLHAWLCTRDPLFRRIAEETLSFMERELALPTGGFASSLDADSEGHEGAFYVWTYEDLKALLGSQWPLFQQAYGVMPEGNWHGVIILQRACDDEQLAATFSLTPENVQSRLAACHNLLRCVRERRPRPARDDKLITSWNALALTAFAEAGRFLNPRYTSVAQHHMHALLGQARPHGALRHVPYATSAKDCIFLEDVAALALAALALYQADSNLAWFQLARELCEEALRRFADPAGGFFDTPNDATALFTRPKQLQDTALPCANALLAEALILLAHFTGDFVYLNRARETLNLVAGLAAQYPLAYSHWLCVMDWFIEPEQYVALIGPPTHPATQELWAYLHRTWHPRRLVASAAPPPPHNAPPWLRQRAMLDGKPTLYSCSRSTCAAPITAPPPPHPSSLAP